MLRSGTYGDHIALHALAQVLRRPIVVWREGHWRQPVEICSVRSVSVDIDWRDPKIIYLLHRDVTVGDEEKPPNTTTFSPPCERSMPRSRSRRTTTTDEGEEEDDDDIAVNVF